LRERKLKLLQKGKELRVSTVLKHKLVEEVLRKNEETGGDMPVAEVCRTNQVPLIQSGLYTSEEARKLKAQVEKELAKYDVMIAKMMDEKLKSARQVYAGKPRVPEGKTLTQSDLNTLIDKHFTTL
jgi:hypothetical protein